MDSRLRGNDVCAILESTIISFKLKDEFYVEDGCDAFEEREGRVGVHGFDARNDGLGCLYFFGKVALRQLVFQSCFNKLCRQHIFRFRHFPGFTKPRILRDSLR